MPDMSLRVHFHFEQAMSYIGFADQITCIAGAPAHVDIVTSFGTTRMDKMLLSSQFDGIVRIERRHYTYRQLYETKAGQRLLIRLRGKARGAIACVCRGREPLPLQVYTVPEGMRLRCYPDTGPMHHQDCLRNGISYVGDGSRRYTSKAISRDGRFWDVHLRDHLIHHGMVRSGAANITNVRGDQECDEAQERATLLTALRAIWQITGLNSTIRAFGDGKADMIAVSRIAEHREILRFNGEAARDVCILPGIDRMATHPRLAGPPRDEITRYAIVIGTIANVERAGDDALVTLRHGEPPLRIAWEAWRDIVTRSPFPQTDAIIKRLSAGAAGDTLVVTLIGRIVRDEEGFLRLVNGALMVVASFWPIPVDSRAELKVLWSLSEGFGRRFVKPLLYRASDLVLPDFVILDSELPTAIEVYGRTGSDDYDRRRDTKRVIYSVNRKTVGYVEVFARKGAVLRLPDAKRGAFKTHKQIVDGLEIRLGLKAPGGTPV